MSKRKCTRCFGRGKYVPINSGNKSDLRTCHICNGSGVLPEGYVVNKQNIIYSPGYVKKTDGIDRLKKLEAW